MYSSELLERAELLPDRAPVHPLQMLCILLSLIAHDEKFDVDGPDSLWEMLDTVRKKTEAMRRVTVD